MEKHTQRACVFPKALKSTYQIQADRKTYTVEYRKRIPLWEQRRNPFETLRIFILVLLGKSIDVWISFIGISPTQLTLQGFRGTFLRRLMRSWSLWTHVDEPRWPSISTKAVGPWWGRAVRRTLFWVRLRNGYSTNMTLKKLSSSIVW